MYNLRGSRIGVESRASSQGRKPLVIGSVKTHGQWLLCVGVLLLLCVGVFCLERGLFD